VHVCNQSDLASRHVVEKSFQRSFSEEIMGEHNSSVTTVNSRSYLVGLHQWNERATSPHAPHIVIKTDASDSGWGAVMDHQMAAGSWDNWMKKQLINYQELMAVHLAIQSFKGTIKDSVVLIRSDNTATVAAINHFSSPVDHFTNWQEKSSI
jgi:hypothetical protein